MNVRWVLLAVTAILLQDPASDGRRWWRHVEFLASDALEGRRTGTPGFEAAAAYVEQQFKDIGLTSGGTSGYRQPVPLESRVLMPEHSRLVLTRNQQEEPLILGEDAVLSARSELDGSIEAPMAFIGYGLSIPEAKWDELAGLDLRGRIAVYVNATAPVDVSDNVASHVSSAGERWAALRQAGAIGLAILPNPRPPAGTTSDPAPATPAGRTAAAGRSLPLQPAIVLADRELQDHAGQIVAMTVSRRGAEKLLAGSGHSIDELNQLIADRKPLPRFPLPGTLRVRAAVRREPIGSANVVAIFEGSDPRLKTEHVVMSAHLDHVGTGRPVDGDGIYNGAMDNASGVASVIEIARLLKQSGAATRRSILFAAVTAEENGLLGSKYLAARPPLPFDRMVADINLDMFLPLYPLTVIEVQGLSESSLGESVRAAAKEFGVDVQSDREPEQNRFIRSDQYSFIRRGIPSLAFKFGYQTGSAEETIRREWIRQVYHKPGDDLKQAIDLDAAARFNRVLLALLQRVANDEARPSWNQDSFFRRFAR